MLFSLDIFYPFYIYLFPHWEKKNVSTSKWLKCKLTWSCIPVVMAGIFSPLTVTEQTVLELCASVEKNVKKPTWPSELKEYLKYQRFMTVIVKNRNLGIDKTHDGGCWTLRGRQSWMIPLYNTNAYITKQARSATGTNFIELTCSFKWKIKCCLAQFWYIFSISTSREIGGVSLAWLNESRH